MELLWQILDKEHGNTIHPGTQKIFRKHNISYDSTKTSQQISQKDFETFDLIKNADVVLKPQKKRSRHVQEH